MTHATTPDDDPPAGADAGDDVQDLAGVPETKHQPLWRKILSAVLTVGVIVIVFGFVIPQLADYDKVLDIIGDITALEWVALAVFTFIFLIAYVFVLMAVLPTLRFREGFVTQTAGTAITNSVPAGGALAFALNYAMLMSWGFTAESITAGLMAAGVWDQLARFALPSLAAVVVAVSGGAPTWMWFAAAAGIAIVIVALFVLSLIFRSESTAEKFGEFLDRIVNWGLAKIHRDPVDMVDSVLQFRHNVISIARHRWAPLTIATVVNHAAMAGLFVASIRAAGISSGDISTAWVIAAFGFGRLLVMIPISPGGLGLVDFGYISLLTAGGANVDANLIAAGVLLFRALSFLPPIPIGLASWLFWRGNKSWRQDYRTARRGEFSRV